MDISLHLLSFEHADREWAFLTNFPSECGFTNPYFGCSKEEYLSQRLPVALRSHEGIPPRPDLVPDSTYIVYLGETPIGIIKIRHYLNPALRKTGNGHIGYGIAKEYRGKGYGKEMLRQGLEILRSRPDFDDEYILLSCDVGNIPSYRTQLACGGITYRKDDKYCQMFPGKKEFGFVQNPDFDPTDASITPFETMQKPCPDSLVICFFHEQIQRLLEAGEIEPFYTIRGENSCPLYQFKDAPVLLMPGLVGAPLTGGFLEELIASGVNRVLCIGGAGVFHKEMEAGGLLLIEGAVREEGFSYHYMPKSRKILANRQELRRNRDFLEANHIPHSQVIAYTTDAYYRETKAKIEQAKRDGASCVEMEQAGLIALCHYRGIEYSAILYGGDDLSGAMWDNRSWKNRSEVRASLLDLAKTILKGSSK